MSMISDGIMLLMGELMNDFASDAKENPSMKNREIDLLSFQDTVFKMYGLPFISVWFLGSDLEF